MVECSDTPELIPDKYPEPQRHNAHEEKKPDQPSIRLILVTFLGGSGLAGIFGYIARIVGSPWTICFNGLAILCLMLAMAGTAYELYPAYKNFIGIASTVAFFAGLIFIGSQIETYLETTPASVLKPPPSPPIPSLKQPSFHEQSETVTFSLGGISVTYDISRLRQKPQKPFDIEGVHPVTMYLGTDNDLLVDFTLWGGPNKPPIEIKGNDFIIRPLGWDRNSNANALEVIDGHGDVVFQLVRQSVTRVLIDGVFMFPQGLLLVASGDKTVMNPPPDSIAKLLPRPIFKYPSWKYPGVYADTSN